MGAVSKASTVCPHQNTPYVALACTVCVSSWNIDNLQQILGRLPQMKGVIGRCRQQYAMHNESPAILEAILRRGRIRTNTVWSHCKM